MEFSVAGQGSNPGSSASRSSFFRETPFANVVNGQLRIDKEAIFRKAKSAPGGLGEDDNFFLRLIEKIKAFLAKLFRVFSRSRGPDGKDGREPTADRAYAEPGLSEGEHELVADGLPPSALDRARQTVDDMVRIALGDNLAASLKGAVAMPEIDRKPALRVLIEQNVNDTRQFREMRDHVQSQVEQMLAPYAEAHGIDTGTALRIFRADLTNGSGVLANRADPNSEIRGHIAEISRLDSSLSALGKARGLISEHAVASGAYTREELADLITQHGHDASFLRADEPAEAAADQSVRNEAGGAESVVDRQRDNVVSMAKFRGTPVERSVEHGDSTVPDEAPVERARGAVLRLVELGAVNRSNGEADALETGVDAEEVFGDESEFESEASGDDLSSLFRKDKSMKASPKP